MVSIQTPVILTEGIQARRKRLVVICPVYNEESNVDYFFARIKEVFASVELTRYECLLVFTNNRSIDGTLDRILAIEREHAWVNHLTLSRNFGYQLSVLSGLTFADGDLYMICDVDCEDPPEILHVFLRGIEAGNDVAYGVRTNRPDSWLMLRCRRAFYFVLRLLGDYTIVPYMAEFVMLKRAVRDAVIANSSTFPFIRAEIGYVGFNLAGVPYRRDERRHGKTHYNFAANFRFAVAGILSSTTFPLRAALYLWPLVLVADVLFCGLYFGGRLTFQVSVMLLLLTSMSYLTGAIAFQSIYLARTYQNALGRKRFIVDRGLTNLSAHGQATEGDGPTAGGPLHEETQRV